MGQVGTRLHVAGRCHDASLGASRDRHAGTTRTRESENQGARETTLSSRRKRRGASHPAPPCAPKSREPGISPWLSVSLFLWLDLFGAEGGTRTPTPFRVPPPQDGVSASSTTSARGFILQVEPALLWPVLVKARACFGPGPPSPPQASRLQRVRSSSLRPRQGWPEPWF